MTPIYTLSVGDSIIQNRLEHLEIRDYAEQRGDTIEITINGQGVAKPTLGVPISVEIGFAETDTWDGGTFIVQEIERSKNTKGKRRRRPNLLTIRGISQPQGDQAIAALQTTHKERSWQAKTFYDIVSEIVEDVGLKADVDDALKDIEMPYTTQRNISDAALLSMLAKERNAFVKFHDDEVIVRLFDSGALESLTVRPEEVSGYHYQEEQYHDIKNVTAKYMDLQGGQTKHMTASSTRSLTQRLLSREGSVTVGAGTGTDTHVLDDTYPDELTARNAAEAKLKALQRITETVIINMPTVPGLFAEKIIELEGFEDAELNQRYVCRAVLTRLDHRGLQSVLHLESIAS